MRIIEAPGIELHEIDRSQYDDNDDKSIVGTTTFLMGFADKGEDYTTKYVNSMKTFVNNYGYPTNEAERYFYNAAYEVINRGGYLLTSKLPYDNESLKKYAFCSYTVDTNLCALSSPYDIVTNDIGNILTNVSLYDLLLMPDIGFRIDDGFLYEKERYIGIDQRKADYLANEDTNYNTSVIKILDEADISLKLITRLFEYIFEQCNFKYSDQ